MIKNFNQKHILVFLLLASVLALAGAYIAQYVFDMQPCQLCFWQRKPFFAIIILAILFLTIGQLKNYQKLAIQIAILLLLINAAIAFYHTGVEQKWFEGLDSCSIPEIQISNVKDLRLALEKTRAVRCDQPQFIFLYLSMAGWNVLYCLLAASFSCFALRKIKTNHD